MRVNCLNHNKGQRQGTCSPEAASVTSEDEHGRLPALVPEKQAQVEWFPSDTPPSGSLCDPFAPPFPSFLFLQPHPRPLPQTTSSLLSQETEVIRELPHSSTTNYQLLPPNLPLTCTSPILSPSPPAAPAPLPPLCLPHDSSNQ